RPPPLSTTLFPYTTLFRSILDLVLPRASSFELLGEWRASPRTADLPVFILTSKDLTPEEQRFLRANAESLLLKQQPWQEALIKRSEEHTSELQSRGHLVCR